MKGRSVVTGLKQQYEVDHMIPASNSSAGKFDVYKKAATMNNVEVVKEEDTFLELTSK
jgi:hypothetical protein